MTGSPYTILRPVFFMENRLGMRKRIEEGNFCYRSVQKRPCK